MRRPLCLVCLAFVGMLYCGLLVKGFPEAVIDAGRKETVTLSGQVCQRETRTSARGTVPVIYLKPVRSAGAQEFPQYPLNGVLCYLQEGEAPDVGSRVLVKGTLQGFPAADNPGEFDSRRYYRILNLDAKLNNAAVLEEERDFGPGEWLQRLRERLSGVMESCFDEKDASVMKTMLLGEKNALDPDVKELYRQNGIAHILAVSGLHISFIGMGLYRLLRRLRLPLPPAACICVAVMAAYGQMTGMGPSAFRAVMMFGIYMLAGCVGRTYDMLTAMAVAAALAAAGQPLYLYHSGFLLSFGAILALGLYTPVLKENAPVRPAVPAGTDIPGRAAVRRVGRRLHNAWYAGLAIFIVTLPIQLHTFYEIPIYSLILNLAVIPLMSAVMCAGLLCMASGCVFLPAARILALLPHFIFLFYEKSCLFFSTLPLSHWIAGRPGRIQTIVYVLLLLFLLMTCGKFPPMIKWLWIFASVLFLTCKNYDGLQVTFIDVGQGDCICIRGDRGRALLIDGGSSSKKNTGVYQILPYLKEEGIATLEAVIVTHSDADHINGIEELLEESDGAGVRVRSLILPDIGPAGRDEGYHRLEESAMEHKVDIRYISRGQRMSDGELSLLCLYPDAGGAEAGGNASSTVLRLTYRNFSALFTGDLEGGGEENLIQYLRGQQQPGEGQGLTLLKVAHHGSRNSTPEEFLSLLNPRIAVISCGRDNRYGHPHAELMERLESSGCLIRLTMEEGAVTVKTDGKTVRMEGYHPNREK